MNNKILTCLLTRAWTGVPSCDNCLTTSSPTPLLPPIINAQTHKYHSKI